MVEYNILPALPQDAPQAARFILAAGPDFFYALYGPRILSYLKQWFRHSRNLFSHRHAWWLVHQGQRVGFLLGFTEAQRKREILPTGRLTLSSLKGEFIRRLPRFLAAAGATGFGVPGWYYISQLVVAAPYRKQGYGKLLIEHACRLARQAGLERVELDVESDNRPALWLYQRTGFREVSSSEVVLGGRCFRFFRLRRDL